MGGQTTNTTVCVGEEVWVRRMDHQFVMFFGVFFCLVWVGYAAYSWRGASSFFLSFLGVYVFLRFCFLSSFQSKFPLSPGRLRHNVFSGLFMFLFLFVPLIFFIFFYGGR
jgi:hypothetical protein